MAYPVSVTIEPLLTGRNRLTTAFRLILAIPHLILVGGGRGGLLNAVAIFLAIISWFTLLFAGTQIAGIRQFTAFYLRWRARAMAYVMLLEDAYPPFGDAPYPVTTEITDPTGPRDRVSIGLRLLFILPAAFVLGIVSIGWTVTTIIAWFAILFTGEYPKGMYDFGVGMVQWSVRLEAYLLLMTDEYPPFWFA